MKVKVTIEFECDLDIGESTVEQVEDVFHDSEETIGVFIDNYSVVKVEEAEKK